jgi:hypothetical protein
VLDFALSPIVEKYCLMAIAPAESGLKQRFSLSDELVKNIAVIAPLIDRALQ